MPFVPHTKQDIKEMLDTIGIQKIETLFDEIPASLRVTSFDLPAGISEMELSRLARERAAQDGGLTCFIGAGAYEHHIPAAVWELTGRGEFMTAYTPYQAEASQGGLQLLYEYQTMMASLMGLEVSNASMYDGATALAEAILMTVRLTRKKHKNSRILMPRTIHPNYRAAVHAIVYQQNIELVDVPYEAATGKIDKTKLEELCSEEVTTLVIPQPNFFGVLDDVDQLTDWAREKQIFSIAVVNPFACALLKPPGQWGESGVDIAVGEGQPLGIPLSSGGPYYGFMCTKQAYVRQMPGRIVGRTVDAAGKDGFVLTLQAREQHIRRGKATSNICTNQGLMVTASTIYMSLLGPEGLRQVALVSHQRTREMQKALSAIPGVESVFSSPYFHETVVRLEQSAEETLQKLAANGIQGGYALKNDYPELGEALLICATETKTPQDIEKFASQLSAVLEGRKVTCPS